MAKASRALQHASTPGRDARDGRPARRGLAVARRRRPGGASYTHRVQVARDPRAERRQRDERGAASSGGVGREGDATRAVSPGAPAAPASKDRERPAATALPALRTERHLSPQPHVMDKPWNRASLGIGLIASVAAVGLETVACEFLLDHRQQDVVMVYLLGVVLLAVRFGYAASIPATVFSVAAFDFFFTTPYFSFGVQDKRLLLTFVLMGFVASVISSQTERIRLREVRTSKLYAMSRELTAARTTDAMASVAQKHLSEVFSGDAWIVLGDTSGELRYAGLQPSAPGLHAAVLAMATDALATGTSVRDAGREWGPLIVLRASAGV